MTKSEMYLGAARNFVPQDRSLLPETAREVRRWVENQVRTIQELSPKGPTRCLVCISAPRRGGELVNCEFMTTGRRNHTITIFATGHNKLVGREPQTYGLGASIALVALLAKELNLPVTL
jgi:hypothetical protein